ncbi:DUF2997 domain-containing protein [Prochlorococcus sp. MIT 1223]|uniref:DUF2997 domain-containing protein n=1 Tax=Prochlorococcus sp. MIT 1223 TaxID=3096217 RepID=UPI002A7505F4|nr:DUF2997 domain-containing protein [Prochlorococcus sp. MIT 1223]
MPQRTLRFKIRQDGLVEETVEGMIGDSCLELTEKLESVLGCVDQRKLTGDSYKEEQVQSQSISMEIH